MSSKAKKSSNFNHGKRRLVGRIYDHIIDFADLLVFLIRNMGSNELTGPKASLNHGRVDLHDRNLFRLCEGR